MKIPKKKKKKEKEKSLIQIQLKSDDNTSNLSLILQLIANNILTALLVSVQFQRNPEIYGVLFVRSSFINESVASEICLQLQSICLFYFNGERGFIVLVLDKGVSSGGLCALWSLFVDPTHLFPTYGLVSPSTPFFHRDAIVTWIKKKTGSGVYNLTTTEEAQKILTSYEKVVLAFLNSLTGPESAELASAARLEDDVNIYQTANPNIAKLFKIDEQAERPALVLLKKEVEKVTYFDGEFTKSAIAEFVFANKHPLITAFTKHNAALIFQSQIKKQLLLFATSKNSALVLPIFTQAAKLFKGKIMFVYIRLDRDDVSKTVASYLGVTENAPKVIAYTVHEDSGKFILDGEVTLEKLKAFGDDFLADKLKPFHKSDLVPETNDGDVKIVVGDNFDAIVLDESKDVLLQIYAPGCDHCQSLEPIYNKLAQNLRSIESIVIAKMDGTTNKHPRAKSDEFPTILFFPAGNKSLDPITVDTDYTLVELYKFLKKNAAIPFKLQKSKSFLTADTDNPKEEL